MIALAPEVTGTTGGLLSVVSASRLQCFHACRLKFYFRYVLELERPASAALLMGKLVHEMVRRWSVARWRGQPCEAGDLEEAFREECEQLGEEGELAQEDRAKAWELVEMYLRETPIPVEEKPEAVEVKVEAELPGMPTLVGIIDLVRPGGVILDFKTSASTPPPQLVLHRHELQLTAYGLLYREATGRKERGLELHHLIKTKQPKLVVSRFGPVSPAQERKFLGVMESYIEGVEREDYVPSPGLQCAACEFLPECQQWKGGKSG